jgi:hypothetical protein
MIKSRKANILAENIIFIVLNLLFLTILVVFLVSKMGSAAVLEEKYAKQIALIVDSAEPGMMIHLNMEDAIDMAEKEGWDTRDIVTKNQNIITVKLREKGGSSYSFFNDVEVNVNPDIKNKEYFFVINEKS